MEHLVGYIVIIASLVLTAAAALTRWLSWRWRWRGSSTFCHKTYGGRDFRLRGKHGVQITLELGQQLRLAAVEVQRAWMNVAGTEGKTGYTPAPDVWVEVVPKGRMQTRYNSGGPLVGGSIDTDRMFPFMKKHYIAVSAEHAEAGPLDGLLVREYARHIIPLALFDDVDADEDREDCAQVERLAKADVYSRR